ncbi:MAG: redoxin domain-containing protein [Solobacterium sp.]|nr:redoxin domain-containing protein [Solobacterium sp.]MBQ6531437.1 redoxin domain-containing protein [Solobacterium sp.]MBR0214793.1 redoxin domain-containing protein [Solobacterium sp.]
MTETLGFGSLFLEGLLGFFSPCVLPLIPLLFGYLTSGMQEASDSQRRIRTLLRTLFFVLGICSVFFLMALGSFAFGMFIQNHARLFQMFGGMFLIVFGLHAAGLIQIPALEKEHRIERMQNGPMNLLQAFLMGFFFSFAWTPCNGPLLASAIVMASTAASRMTGMLYIASFCAGFILMFLLIGLFTEEALAFLGRHRDVVKYTQKLGGALIICMGSYMLWQTAREINQIEQAVNTASAGSQPQQGGASSVQAEGTDLEKYGFTLPDKDNNPVNIKDYSGKTIVVTFFGTWCHYCNELLPDLETVNNTREDVQIVLVATPNLGSEGNVEYIEKYMADKGYDMQIVYDSTYEMTQFYGVSGYPTTFIYQPDETMFGYVPGYITAETLNEYLDRAASNERQVQ